MTFHFFSTLEMNNVKTIFASYFGKKNNLAPVSTSLVFTFPVRSMVLSAQARVF